MDAQKITITFRNLGVIHYDSDEPLPLSKLDFDEYSDIHGGLRVRIGKRDLPYMGYWHENDVCIPTWLIELHRATSTLSGGANASYVFDEGEQGQPAFRFQREDSIVYLSIVNSEISDGVAHPDWQNVPFSMAEFVSEVNRFTSDFRTHLQSHSSIAEEWIKRLKLTSPNKSE